MIVVDRKYDVLFEVWGIFLKYSSGQYYAFIGYRYFVFRLNIITEFLLS